jgi:hypothetical protein
MGYQNENSCAPSEVSSKSSGQFVEIRRGAGITVVGHGMSSDHHVLNAVFVQTLQEFSEVFGRASRIR